MIQALQILNCKIAKDRLQSAPWKLALYFYYFTWSLRCLVGTCYPRKERGETPRIHSIRAHPM